MTLHIKYTNAHSSADIASILDLQAQNHYSNIDEEEAAQQGFVTCIHDSSLLEKMNSPHPHIIAKDGSKLIAYALVMTKEHSNALDILKPMFDKINSLKYNGDLLSETEYVVMGQICIHKAYRSLGVFDKLYEQMASQLSPHFKYIITEVDANNLRSLAAHKRCGFETINVYNSGKDWHLILKVI